MPTKHTAVVLIAILLALGGCATADKPLARRDDSSIRAWVLIQTPLGSDTSRVRKVLDRHGWEPMIIDRRHRIIGARPTASKLAEWDATIGSYSVFYKPFDGETDVEVSWIFADGQHLSDVRIRRLITGL